MAATKEAKPFEARSWNECNGQYGLKRLVSHRYHKLKRHLKIDSPHKDEMLRRVAFMLIILETEEVKAASGDPFDQISYVQTLHAVQGLLNKLGWDNEIEKASKLDEYLAGKRKK